MGYDGGMLRAICPSGYASAVIVTQEYIAPEAPSDGRILGVATRGAAAAAGLALAATAAAHVSVVFGAWVGDAS